MVPDAKYPLELVNANLNDKDCWGPAVEGCTYVFHIASPFPTPGQMAEAEIIADAVGGVVNVLTACAESGSVKRVVVTSSVAAVSCGMNGCPGFANDYNYTEDDWSVEDACPPYEKSKLKAERAGWDYVDKLEESKKFELVVVNPGYIQGPLLSKASGGGTASVPITLLERQMPAVPNVSMPIIDVRDVVAGEIAAMFTPSAAGKRFILVGGTITLKEFAIIVSNEFRGQGYKVPTGTIPKFVLWGMKFFNDIVKETYPGVNKKHTWSNERMKTELGVSPRPMDKSILDTCYSVIEFGLVAKTPGYLGPPESRNQPQAATEGDTSTSVDATEAQPSDETEAQPSDETEAQPSEETEAQPSDETEVKPSDETDVKPSDETEIKPSDETEIKPSEETEAQPSDETEVKPSDETEVKPSKETPVSEDN